jgi:hypothetical protein
MAHLVKPQVKAYPVSVTFLGADAVVMRAHHGVKLLPQARLGRLAVHMTSLAGCLYSIPGFTIENRQANTVEAMIDQLRHCFKREMFYKATPCFRSYTERYRYALTPHAV